MKDHKGTRRLYRLISKASRSKEVVVGYGKNVTQKKEEKNRTTANMGEMRLRCQPRICYCVDVDRLRRWIKKIY